MSASSSATTMRSGAAPVPLSGLRHGSCLTRRRRLDPRPGQPVGVCRERDLNPHALRQSILSAPCLPFHHPGGAVQHTRCAVGPRPGRALSGRQPVGLRRRPPGAPRRRRVHPQRRSSIRDPGGRAGDDDDLVALAGSGRGRAGSGRPGRPCRRCAAPRAPGRSRRPRSSASWERVAGWGEGEHRHGGRSRASARAESPVVVKVTRYLAPMRSPISAAARVMAPADVWGAEVRGAIRSRPWSSVFSMIRAIVVTASIGKAPIDVSPDSMRASAPSSTALAASEASARVGRGSRSSTPAPGWRR
jgi:hypothetical protein